LIAIKLWCRMTVAVPTVISVASMFLLCAPAANADNQSFLGAMNGLGLTSKDGVEGLLQVGKAACGMLAPSPGLMFGRAPNLVAQIVWQNNPLLERNEAAELVNAAIDNLCPGVNPLGYAAV
jgi:hypothetical protein